MSGSLRAARRRRSGARWLGRRAAPLGVVASVAALGSGCGLGAGPAPSAVTLTVSRDFGATVVRSWRTPRVHGQETVLSLLERNANVATRFGGGFIQSIDNLSDGQQGGEPVDWFFYVNGLQAPKGAASTTVHPGDHIWWDRHDWSQTEDVPAVVGSFPEPFLNGIDGKRLPVRVECSVVDGHACRTVTARLRAAGVPAALAALGGGGGQPQTLRVEVGPWSRVSAEAKVRAIERGPGASGVYARFSASGRAVALLDQDGRQTGTLGPGGGLIAAVRSREDAPVWVVTGTDSAGVDRAAQAFDQATLGNRFAVAVAPSGPIALPQAAGRG